MSHFAKLDANNVVVDVVVGNDSFPNEGYDFIVENFPGKWVKTSYNGNIRKNFGQVGFTYDEVRDAFIPPKPFQSWILDEETCQWGPPTPYPEDGKLYNWDEPSQTWIEVND